MMKNAAFLVVFLSAAAVVSAQQLLVFPAVTDEQSGVNGSLWVTTTMVIKADPMDDVTVRRKWVCLKDGGFLDDPATAPSWRLEPHSASTRLLHTFGGELLGDSGNSTGAVGLEIEGGEVIAHSNIMDIRWGDYEPRSHRRAFGQGQHVAALREPLLGSSHIPWLGGCSGRPCSVDQPGLVQYLRNNIGIVNPNPETLTVVGTVLPFGLVGRDGLLQGIEEWDGWLSSESFSITVPAFGWKQFNWTSVQDYSGDPFYTFFPHVGFVISLAPDREDLPYYAYASVIFSPDPSTGVPEFNDPMFIPAEPGCIVPISEGRGDP